MLTACGLIKTTEVKVVDTSCSVFKQINYDCPNPIERDKKLIDCGGGDTPETVIQVREHNAVFEKLCPDKR